MELILVNESKLKVMLTEEDLEDFALKAEELDYSNTETKRLFWDILSRAKHSVGFNTDGMRVLVQLFPSRAGGCEMYITKLGIGCTEQRESGDSEQPQLHYKPSHRTDAGTVGPGAFGFDRMGRMLTVCHRLRSIGYGGKSAAYLGDDRRYYLFLEGLDTTGYLPLDEYSFITEYGTRENLEALRRFLSEHGKPICQTGAVEQLGVLSAF
ncbi:MAG: adaptor protein MecA [Ruminococcaceae bacterium]|nr:adaptor protein MecA [Oscillospiraceae bacterium]